MPASASSARSSAASFVSLSVAYAVVVLVAGAFGLDAALDHVA